MLPPAHAGPPLLPDGHVLSVDRPADPLDCGSSLSGGVLAPLPAKIRLLHVLEQRDDLARAIRARAAGARASVAVDR